MLPMLWPEKKKETWERHAGQQLFPCPGKPTKFIKILPQNFFKQP